MVDATVRRAPRLATPRGVRLLPAATRFSLRGGAEVMAAASVACGIALPAEACRATSNGSRSALWLGPDEQLLLAPEAEHAALDAALAGALGGLPHSRVDISHRQVALEISGADATWLLSSGCPLDLDLAAFPVGMCTRTLYGKADIVLWRTGSSAFHVEVWRSFAEYLAALLAETARERSA